MERVPTPRDIPGIGRLHADEAADGNIVWLVLDAGTVANMPDGWVASGQFDVNGFVAAEGGIANDTSLTADQLHLPPHIQEALIRAARSLGREIEIIYEKKPDVRVTVYGDDIGETYNKGFALICDAFGATPP